VTNITQIATSTVAMLALALGASAAGIAPAAGAQSASPGPASPLELAVRPDAGSVNSLNSAGYAVSRSRTRFRSVRATFFVPYLNCAQSRDADSSDWVGLDGFVGQPGSAEQAGIGADCTRGGRSSYHAWFAMYPRAQARAKVAIRGGDSVTASVSYDPADREFSLALTDNTTGGHFGVRRRCPRGVTCPRNSAELISSAPVSRTTGHPAIKPLADYGAVSFTAVSITDRARQQGGLRSAHWAASRIAETRQAAPFQVIARPTPIQAGTFDNYWSRER
jgi:hypothetical protein